MSSRRPSASGTARVAAGFTLIELMIGVLIGLLATLAVTHVLVNSEGQKRSTTSGSDAQINGALALTTLQRTIRSAGYGFAASPAVINCQLAANYEGAVVGMPARMVPVTITQGAAGAPDEIRVFSSGKKTFSLPLRVVVPGYAVGDTTFPLSSVRGVEIGDLMVAATTTRDAPCEMFRVTSIASATKVGRADGKWNAAGFPAQAYPDGSVAINMGEPMDVTYRVQNGALRATTLNIAAGGAPSYDAAPVELYANIVQLRALYGKDNTADDKVNIDTWDNVTPATNADWTKVVAVRVAIVARSEQYEKEEVTFGDIAWDVGSGVPVAGSATCGASKCLTLKLDDGGTEWKHYRYRVFDTVIPLRNMLWNS